MRERVVGNLGILAFSVIKPFGLLPDGMSYGGVSARCVDSKDRVYILQRSDQPIIVFDRKGNFLTSFGDGKIIEGHGMSISNTDDIWVTDKDGHVALRFNTLGEITMKLGNYEMPKLQEPFSHPSDVAVHRNGDIYISDGYGNSTIHHFSPEGKLIKSWGKPGDGPGEFTVPHALAFDSKDRLFVCDRENYRIQIFNPEGVLIDIWQDQYKPMDIYIDKKDRIFVTDQVPRISVLDGDGKLIARGLHRGHGIWGDSVGNIYSCWPQPNSNPVVKLELIEPDHKDA